MGIAFTKMHALGNDFMVIDGINQKISLTPEHLLCWSDRHTGVGFDQLLLIESSGRDDADFRYRIFNADGSEVGQCGNGARCVARFLHDRDMTDKASIPVITSTGRLLLQLHDDGQVTVDMGIPAFEPAAVPMNMEAEASEYGIETSQGNVAFGAVSVGNPHAVITVDDIESAPVRSLGPEIETDAIFPERVNAGFMQITDRRDIRLRVWERGAGETLACGSGACAAAVIGIRQGVLDSPVTVSLPGGDLVISWSGAGQPVMLTGPASYSYEGIIDA